MDEGALSIPLPMKLTPPFLLKAMIRVGRFMLHSNPHLSHSVFIRKLACKEMVLSTHKEVPRLFASQALLVARIRIHSPDDKIAAACT